MASEIHILIGGLGIAGLMLGCLFEKAEIKYTIFERHHEYNPLGSAVTLETTVMPMLEQLGLLQEILKVSKTFGAMIFREQDLKVIGSYSSRNNGFDSKERYGYDNLVLARRDLIKILKSRIPSSKILFGKRILEVRQNAGEVMISCADKSVYNGDILIGADGAYSAVRQSIYADLQAKNLLPKSDMEPLGWSYECLVGVTEELDVNVIPSITDRLSDSHICLAKDGTFSWWCIPLKNHQLSWMICKYQGAGKKFTSKQLFKHSHWSVEDAQAMAQEYRHLKTPLGVDMAYFMDKTPTGSMAKVMLEEKFFKTWYHQRVLLVGDACHKVEPFGGQGANQAIHDALALANLLYDLPSTSLADILTVFDSFYKQRSPMGKKVVQVSRSMGKLMNRKGLVTDVVRKVVLNHCPSWVLKKSIDKISLDRPQAIFLPFIDAGGQVKARVQQHSRRYKELKKQYEMEEREQEDGNEEDVEVEEDDDDLASELTEDLYPDYPRPHFHPSSEPYRHHGHRARHRSSQSSRREDGTQLGQQFNHTLDSLGDTISESEDGTISSGGAAAAASRSNVFMTENGHILGSLSSLQSSGSIDKFVHHHHHGMMNGSSSSTTTGTGIFSTETARLNGHGHGQTPSITSVPSSSSRMSSMSSLSGLQNMQISSPVSSTFPSSSASTTTTMTTESSSIGNKSPGINNNNNNYNNNNNNNNGVPTVGVSVSQYFHLHQNSPYQQQQQQQSKDQLDTSSSLSLSTTTTTNPTSPPTPKLSHQLPLPPPPPRQKQLIFPTSLTSISLMSSPTSITSPSGTGFNHHHPHRQIVHHHRERSELKNLPSGSTTTVGGSTSTTEWSLPPGGQPGSRTSSLSWTRSGGASIELQQPTTQSQQ